MMAQLLKVLIRTAGRQSHDPPHGHVELVRLQTTNFDDHNVRAGSRVEIEVDKVMFIVVWLPQRGKNHKYASHLEHGLLNGIFVSRSQKVYAAGNGHGSRVYIVNLSSRGGCDCSSHGGFCSDSNGFGAWYTCVDDGRRTWYVWMISSPRLGWKVAASVREVVKVELSQPSPAIIMTGFGPLAMLRSSSSSKAPFILCGSNVQRRSMLLSSGVARTS